MGPALLQGALIALVSVLLNAGVFYLLFNKTDTIRRLKSRIDNIEQQEIAILDQRLNSATHSRKAMHEHMRDNLVGRRECISRHEQQEKDVNSINRHISGLQSQLNDVSERTSETKAIVSLIAGNMNIDIGKHKG